MHAFRLTSLIALAIALAGCDAGFKGVAFQPSESGELRPLDTDLPATTAKARPVTVKWAANPEQAVNAPGGGYKVAWNKRGVTATATKTVAYQAGAQAPTSVTLTLEPGTYEIQVVAYSALNAGSAPSSKMTVTVPEAQ